jgi:hypothetical protein
MALSDIHAAKFSFFFFFHPVFLVCDLTVTTWFSCSGPSRFDWDRSDQAWVYRRTKANLLNVLESEMGQLFGEPIKLA